MREAGTRKAGKQAFHRALAWAMVSQHGAGWAARGGERGKNCKQIRANRGLLVGDRRGILTNASPLKRRADARRHEDPSEVNGWEGRLEPGPGVRKSGNPVSARRCES